MTAKFLEVVVCEGVTDEARAVLRQEAEPPGPHRAPRPGAPRPARAARHRRRAPRPGRRRPAGRRVDLEGRDEAGPDGRRDGRPPLPRAGRRGRHLERDRHRRRERRRYGIGGGRTSRVDAAGDAVGKAGERAKGACAASDAFFPFPDGLLLLADAGVTACVEPGGSVKDAEVIAAADARGMALVFSGRRHFRH